MSHDGHVPSPPSRKRLLVQIGAAFVVASLVVGLFVLPAEFGVDPTGFGRVTGLSRLAAPQEVKIAAPAGLVAGGPLHRPYSTTWRTDTIVIPLTSAEEAGGELEFKVKMKPGATLVYSWTVEGLKNPEEFYYDLHSQSDPHPKIQVISHEAKIGSSGNGALVAPFQGIHGWYLQNQSIDPVKVHLQLAGFYELMTPREVIEAGEASAAETPGPPA